MSEMLTELIQGTVVPKLGLGTFELVGEAAIDTVQKAVETGYRHFDTASKYGNEQAVGEGLSRSGLSKGRVFSHDKGLDYRPASRHDRSNCCGIRRRLASGKCRPTVAPLAISSLRSERID